MNFQSLVDESIATLESLRNLSEPFERASQLLVNVLSSGGKVLTCGNGGSAADAMHLATELVCRFEKARRHLPAICLNASGPDLTAMANDFGYDGVFARQLEAFAEPRDLLIALSTSGKSPSIVEALKVAESRELNSIALLGKDGGECLGRATIELLVGSDSTARVQEAHQVLIHALCQSVDEFLTRH